MKTTELVARATNAATRRCGLLRPLLLVLPLFGAACHNENEVFISRFRVHVHCQTAEGRAVPGVLVSGGKGSSARSDSQGNVALAFEGREGEEVSFRVERLPPGLELADGVDLRRVVLKNYTGEVSRGGISEIQHDIPLRNRLDSYVVMVYADHAGGQPIFANGAEVARLNSRGAAVFRHEGKPGEELVVAIQTGDDPRASRPDPKTQFQLPETDRLLKFHSDLVIAAVAPKPPKKHSKPAPIGPKKIIWDKLPSLHKQ